MYERIRGRAGRDRPFLMGGRWRLLALNRLLKIQRFHTIARTVILHVSRRRTLHVRSLSIWLEAGIGPALFLLKVFACAVQCHSPIFCLSSSSTSSTAIFWDGEFSLGQGVRKTVAIWDAEILGAWRRLGQSFALDGGLGLLRGERSVTEGLVVDVFAPVDRLGIRVISTAIFSGTLPAL